MAMIAQLTGGRGFNGMVRINFNKCKLISVSKSLTLPVFISEGYCSPRYYYSVAGTSEYRFRSLSNISVGILQVNLLCC